MLAEVVNLVFSLFTGILSVLPSSFVRDYISQVGALEYLSYVNYFIPFNVMYQIGEKWLTCCALYLVYYYVKAVYSDIKEG